MSAGFSREPGLNCAVTFADGVARKTTHEAFELEEATRTAALLCEYAVALAAEPINTAHLYDCGIEETATGLYKVTHSMEFVDGPSLAKLEGLDRHRAVTDVVGSMCAMTTIQGDRPGVLQVPFDSYFFNWHIGPDGKPKAVDLFWPYVRQSDGRIAVAVDRPVDEQLACEREFAWLDEMIPDLLKGTAPRNLPADQLRQWLYGTLPVDMDGAVRASVEQAIEGIVRWRVGLGQV